jgi:hypothetical protein
MPVLGPATLRAGHSLGPKIGQHCARKTTMPRATISWSGKITLKLRESMLTTIYFQSENCLVFGQGRAVSDVMAQGRDRPGKGLELELASDLLTPILLLATDKIKIHKSLPRTSRRPLGFSSICTLKWSSFITVCYSTYLKFGPGKAFARMVSAID